MKVLKINDNKYINEETICSIDIVTGYIHLNSGESFVIDTAKAKELVGYEEPVIKEEPKIEKKEVKTNGKDKGKSKKTRKTV